MGGRYQLGSVPKRLRRRVNLITTASMAAIGAALTVGVLLVEGIRFAPRTWAIVSAVAALVVVGVVVAIRSLTDADRAVLADARRRTVEPPPATGSAGSPGHDADLVIDLDDELGVVDLDATRVALRPGPIWRRRLAGRPDLLQIVGDRSGLDVPAWLVERRPRVVDPYDVVTIRWSTIERFRVRANSDGPNTYEVTCRPTPGMPTHWLIRRQEITDEVTLLDHARTVGRITIQLEDSIASG